MLTQVRSSLTGVVAYIIIAIVIVAFAFVGIPDLRNFAQSSALEIGSTKYNLADVQQQFNRDLSQLRGNGQQITREEAIASGVLGRTISNMKTRAAVEEDARELRVTTTPELVQNFIKSQNENFDRNALQQILQAYGISIVEFRDAVRSDLIRTQILRSVATPVSVPDALSTPYILRENEQRSIRYFKVTSEDLPAIAEPSADDLQLFYQENAADYTDPEYRTFRALILRKDDFAEGLEVNEEDLKKLFEVRKARLDVPETRTYQSIVYQNEADARAAIARLNDGASFEMLAQEQSLSMDMVTFTDKAKSALTDPNVADGVFDAELNSVVGPLEGVFGFTIARVTAITEGTSTTFEEQREALSAEMLDDQTTDRLLTTLEAIESVLDTGAGIEEAISEHEEASLQSFGPVDSTLLAPDGTPVSELPLEVLAEAFILQPADESVLTDLDDGNGYFMVVVDDVIAPELQPFADVEQDVTERWRLKKQREAIAAKGEELTSRIKGGEDFATVAAETGASPVETAIRFQADPNLPSDFLRPIFLAELGAVLNESAEGGLETYIISVDGAEIQPSVQGNSLQALYNQSLSQVVSQELMEAYVTSLQMEIGVKENTAQLSQLFATDEQ